MSDNPGMADPRPEEQKQVELEESERGGPRNRRRYYRKQARKRRKPY